MRDYERIEESLGRVMSYAQLLFSADSTDPEHGKFYQTMSERVTAISTHLLFFTLELNRIGEAEIAEKLQDPALARYALGSAICACSCRTSSPTSWKSCCTRRT